MSSNISINKEIENYINNHSLKLNKIQKEIILYNESLGQIKRMQIAISQCHFLHLIIKISKIKKILEIGTFTGLSTLSMSLALPADGQIIALDKNNETTKIALNFFKKANQDNKIQTLIAPALDSLKLLKEKKEKFELVFIDADKENYKNYYEASLDLIDVNGLIITDNVLWHGDVIDRSKNDKFTNIIREFNSFVKDDIRVEKIILPIGDGITICKKV